MLSVPYSLAIIKIIVVSRQPHGDGFDRAAEEQPEAAAGGDVLPRHAPTRGRGVEE